MSGFGDDFNIVPPKDQPLPAKIGTFAQIVAEADGAMQRLAGDSSPIQTAAYLPKMSVTPTGINIPASTPKDQILA